MKRKDVDEKYPEIIKLYIEDKKSITAIARQMDCNFEVIKRILKENNIQLRPQKFYVIGKISFNKGKSYEEIYGEEKAKMIREKVSISSIEQMKREGMKERLSNIKLGKPNPHKGIKRPEFSGEKHPMFGKIGILNPNFGKSISLETRKKLSATKQDIPLDKWEKFTSLDSYDEGWIGSFKRKIRKRDNQICMNCGIHRENLNYTLECHHINYNKKLSIHENCISLCKKCHAMTNFNRHYWTKLFQDKLSKLYNYQYSQTGEVILNIVNH